MNLQKIKGIFPQVLAEFPDIVLVYLFGSRVSGRIGPLSDFDFAILAEPHEGSPDLALRFQHAQSLILNTAQIDVVLLNDTAIELAYHVISEGRLLYQKDTYTRVEYEAKVMGLYGDYLPVLRLFREQVLQGEDYAKRVQRYREALGRTLRTAGAPRTPKSQNTR